MDPVEFKRIRTKLGLTQFDVAKALGFSSATVVSNIETGFRRPNKLAAALLMILDELPESEARQFMDRLANTLRIQSRESNETVRLAGIRGLDV